MTTASRVATSVLLVCAACGSDEPAEVRSTLDHDDAPSAANLDELVASNTAFAADLYRFASAQPGNLFMSPHSISTTLAMTYAGAGGTTASQLAAALHFDLPPAELHEAMNALDLELAAREAGAPSNTIPFRLRSASSVWGQIGFPLGGPFLDTLAVNYDAGVHVVDFAASEASRQEINGWVADQTAGKIEELLPDGVIHALTRLVLTNAMYFSAAWTEPFEVGDTVDATFQTPTGPALVPTMHQASEEMGYGEGPRFRAGELRYDGDKVSMVVVLPELLAGETGDPLALLEAELTGEKLLEIGASLHEAYLDIALPKFRFGAPLDLGEALQSFGMTDAFDISRADFTPINPEPGLHIGAALHQGFIGIDEHGTEAAAATAVVIDDDAAPLPFVVDRPFLVLIRDLPTGAILFIGRVVDPR